MEDKKEPLLKDEEETFPFLKDKPENKGSKKNNLSIIITILITIIVLYCFGNTIYSFYLGFKYYDLRFEDETQKIIDNDDGEKAFLDNDLISVTYQKIDITSTNELASLLSKFYGPDEITFEKLDEDEKILLILSNIANLNCSNTEVSVTLEDLTASAKNLFNDVTVLEDIQNAKDGAFANFLISYDSLTNLYKVSLASCPFSDDFLVKEIDRATTKDDELYIYEKFGYLKYEGKNIYSVYDSTSLDNLVTTFNDENNDRKFTNLDVLPTYKWTYKKGNDDNNYYFVSLTRV